MAQVYSDPKRESDPHALPDVEVFYNGTSNDQMIVNEIGWYWWSCSPGCLPDGDPVGPFETAAEAKADAQNREG